MRIRIHPKMSSVLYAIRNLILTVFSTVLNFFFLQNISFLIENLSPARPSLLHLHSSLAPPCPHPGLFCRHLNMLSCAIFSELEGEDYVDYVPITNTEPSRHITVKFILKTIWYLCVFCFFLF
jgi:hypothetical protein